MSVDAGSHPVLLPWADLETASGSHRQGGFTETVVISCDDTCYLCILISSSKAENGTASDKFMENSLSHRAGQ